MKSKSIGVLVVAVLATAGQLFSQVSPSGSHFDLGTPGSEILSSVLATPSAQPRGPQDVVRDYEEAMQSITQQFSGRVAQIGAAVNRGELSRDQAEEITAEQYQLAQMQFDLLSTLREILQQDIARVATATRPAPATSEQNGIVMAALPFSSLQLNQSIIEYLDLSPAQVESIEKLMSDERSSLAPLMAQMQETKDQLVSVTEQGQTKDNKEVKALAATQARNLTKLIVANSQMRIKIYQLLSPTQQKKLDEFQRQ